jgi:hypothetical protein
MNLNVIIMTHTEPIITKCKIGPFPRPMPEGIFDKMPSVTVTLSNGESLTLFQYYPDEISFLESEFIGLTVTEANDLITKKDVKYIKT